MLMESKMFECPGEPGFVLYQQNGMWFRGHQGSFSTSDKRHSEETQQAVYKAAIEFPTQLYDKVVGKHKASVNDLRRQTKCKLFTTEGKVNSSIVITANSQEELDEAKVIVKAHIDGVRNSEPFTHFITIPCVDDPVFSDAVKQYVQRINGMCSLTGDAMDNIHRLNIMLLTLRIIKEDQVQIANEVMKKVVDSFQYTGKNHVEIMGINAIAGGQEGPRAFYAQLRGSDETTEFKELQSYLADELRSAGLDIVEAPEHPCIYLLKKQWAKGENWGGPSMIELSFNTTLPPAPVKSIALCRRYVWRPQNFYYTIGSVALSNGTNDEDNK